MRYRVPLWLCAMLLVGALASGCGSLSGGPPVIASLTLTDAVDGHSREPLRALTGFGADTRQMIASVRVERAREGTRVEARWYFDAQSNGSFTLVDTAEVVLDRRGARQVAFSLRPASRFPAGAYKVELRLDGALAAETTFRVESR